MRAVSHPVSWEQVGAFGQLAAIDERRTRISLSGTPGNGVRWHFTGLPTGGVGDPDIEVLLKVGIRGYDAEMPNLDSLGRLTALTAQPTKTPAAEITPRILALDPASPYGHTRAGAAVADGQVVLRDRDDTRDDLAQDYLRLRLPRDVIAADGSVVIQLTRLEASSALVISRDSSALLAVPGGGFMLNLIRGGLVLLASAGLLTAFTLAIAAVTNLGVATLGGLTLFFAGSALGAMREVVSSEDTSQVLRRVIGLGLEILPDFDRFTVAARLAASESVGWTMVAQSWAYFGVYSIIFLGLAWVAMRRSEM
jgi:hypothetical protein